MSVFLDWFLLLLGAIVLAGTMTIFRLLVLRQFAGRYIYLTRGLLLGGGMVFLWLALAAQAGAWAALLGILAEITAAALTAAAVRRHVQ